MDVLDFTEEELLESEPVAEPLLVSGTLCHGGLRADGSYLSPRTAVRAPAIAAWQENHEAVFGTELLDAPIDAWPPAYPNVAQAKHLLKNGVRDPIIAILTRIGTVEGFGAGLRYLAPGRVAPADIQSCFSEDITCTATWHLGRGLIEAHARDEAGWGPEAGHNKMWFAVRDVAFEHLVTEDQTDVMLRRMGVQEPGGATATATATATAPAAAASQGSADRLVAAIDPGLEALLRTMTSVLFIEIRAFHLFKWAEDLLSDETLVAGEGLPARLVSYIRQDETPHVEYLRTALSEMRDRTFLGVGGELLPGCDVVGTIWRHAFELAHRVREPQTRAAYLAEVERALEGRINGSDLLMEYNELATRA
jgi:hypothetical protein